MFLNAEERTNLPVSHPFVNTSEGFQYLGIKITPKIYNISTANYESLVTEVSEKITRLTQSVPLAPPPLFFVGPKSFFGISRGILGSQDSNSLYYSCHMIGEDSNCQI